MGKQVNNYRKLASPGNKEADEPEVRTCKEYIGIVKSIVTVLFLELDEVYRCLLYYGS